MLFPKGREGFSAKVLRDYVTRIRGAALPIFTPHSDSTDISPDSSRTCYLDG